ncbi:MAG TPA: GNAT family protein [Verrucomicrobiae bacterium]
MRVRIRRPTPADAPAFIAAVRRSRSLHHPWVSPPRTRKEFARYLERAASESHRCFLIVHRGTKEIVGVINVNNLIRGAFQNAFLGYYGFLPHAKRGLMYEGMRLVINYAFKKLKLHRLEANIQPGNRASIALVRKCGFVREGFSRRYLKIAGRWRDHERWAILREGMGS